MYMSCTCSGIIYMLLTVSFSTPFPSFHPTMYMFVQNSKKNPLKKRRQSEYIPSDCRRIKVYVKAQGTRYSVVVTV